MFGYSFATWRFHLRGETIRSAADIGWMRDLTVGKMMRQDVRTIAARDDADRRLPRSISARLDRLCGGGRRQASVTPAWSRSPTPTRRKRRRTSRSSELAHQTGAMLLPGMAIKEAVLAFDRAEAEALAVVDSYDDRRVIGLLSEAYALRRYAAELERRRRELIGDE